VTLSRSTLARIVAAVLVTLAAARARAGALPDKPTERVNDAAGILSAAAKSSIEAKLAAYERETSNQIVVATIPTLGGEEINDFTNRLFERWGLGQKGRDNGVLLLVAMEDRKARIEVGYGLEDRLTDALSRRILEERLFPAFREKQFASGISEACDGIIQATQGAYVARARERRGNSVPPLVIIFVVIVVLIILFGLQRGGTLGRGGGSGFYRSGPLWWGGGGGGFGGFSGGGGMSGGGGASGSW
jgi:uncharacterized protein